MKDNEIIKALECCGIDNKDCLQCSLQNKWDCHLILRNNVVDLINRQKAEIERLNVYCENLEISQNHLLNELATARKTAKTEAIKEFAERLKKEYSIYPINSLLDVSRLVGTIDNLVKEMTENEEKG